MLLDALAGDGPGFGMMHIEMGLHKLRHIFPLVAFQLTKDHLHPFQRGHRVVIYQTLTSQASDLIDDVRLGL